MAPNPTVNPSDSKQNRACEENKTTWWRLVEEEKRATGWQSWATVRAIAANPSGQEKNVKALCNLWHGEIQVSVGRQA